ncbi:hypothetical protein Clacol_007272 [Clathrus columnatus]|uniref:Uncharacterized protein n=1 Tax=Clathrus columnatus TaxID=1419009 RepID=A0AAV5AHP9_9AGAM|nr:hypothetical protein Clacol_007272 [Clathrus columnatus]
MPSFVARGFLFIVILCLILLLWRHREVLTQPISLGLGENLGSENDTVLSPLANYTSRPDGLLEANMDGRHPIQILMEEGKKKWKALNDKQSKTLYQAVTEYKRRHGYPPPVGFDQWWEYAKKHNVKLVDEFDQINYDVTPYLAVPSEVFRQRVKELDVLDVGFHFNITKGNFDVYGPGWWLGNPRQLTSIIMEFSRGLPDMNIHGHESLHGDIWLGEDLRKDARDKVEVLEPFTDAEVAHFERIDRNDRRNLTNVCLSDDPVFVLSHAVKASYPAAFIESHVNYLRVCSSPGLLQSGPLFFSPSARDLKLIPYFVFSKSQPGAGFLLPTTTWNYHDMALIEPYPWHERVEPNAHKLFWRGPANGGNWHKGLSQLGSGVSWRNGSRAKLAIMFGKSDATPQDDVEILLEDALDQNKLVVKKYSRAFLNERWMDIGLTGGPSHCSHGDGTCEEMNKTTLWKHPAYLPTIGRKKFFVDIDGDEWSADFQRRLAFGQ